MDDYDPTSIPPIPQRYRNLQTPEPRPRRRSLPPASRPTEAVSSSPEVISSLITSFSVITKPADHHPDRPAAPTTLSVPTSPPQGSFGVDYGAFHQPSIEKLRSTDVPLDELAASAPVIRTAKPPSGFSPLTAAKSPARDASGGLKSLLRSSSRPSSKGSLGSRDDAQSIGNLSIERGSAPTPELKRQRSFDSWGRKQGRAHRGLMYMSSKERLRDNEEKKRASIGDRSSNSFTGTSLRPDPFLAETPISEEPAYGPESPTPGAGGPQTGDMASPSWDSAVSPRPIPARDSSLFKTGSNAKRSSARSSRSKRESGGNGTSDIIFEGEEQTPTREASRRKHLSRHASENDLARASADASGRSFSRPFFERTHTEDLRRTGPLFEEDDVEDSAPFPAVAQGRRRDEYMDRNRRKSGRDTPDAGDTLKMKRSSSRLKRLSAPLSPKVDESQTSSRNSAASPDPRNSMPAGYERPRSADSVDDAVESYLCSPRLSQKIRHPQTGRVISFSEVGDADGSAVFCCVGMGLTRYITAFYDELALTLKLRLITPDRPGVGDSEPYADGTATPLSWPDDVYAICQALKITKFSILAHSAGAIYALATALRMPQHIRGKIHLLAPWIPPSQMNVFGTSQALPPTNAIPTSQRILRALPATFLKAANSSFMSATSSSITSSLPKTPRRSKRKSVATTGRDTPATLGNKRDTMAHLDKENLGLGFDRDDLSGRPAPTATENMDRIRPTGTASAQSHYDAEAQVFAAASDALMDKERQAMYDTRLTHAIWELATTGANPAVDLLVCLERRHTIGFRYVDITRPVVIHHGSRDTRVPVDNVKWLGKTMKRCEVRVLEGEGHGLMASAGVMGAVLMEISKEWDDWLRATSKKDGDRGRRTGTR
ncbi:hypothetical protein EsH8_I_001586 [Colletotrichum jinshuiense]